MNEIKQLSLFPENDITKNVNNFQEWGTFKDSLQAPIYRWFSYPAGFSYKAVENSFQKFNISSGATIYDPFMGSGTTNITAKKMGINSYGMEAHPFIYRIANAKINWDIDFKAVRDFLTYVQKIVPDISREYLRKNLNLNTQFMEYIFQQMN